MPKNLVGIVANREKAPVRALGPLLERLLKAFHVRPLALAPGRSSKGLSGCRFVLSLGGDGTMLTAARIAAPAGLPVLGVNLGTLGFITPVPADRLAESLESALKGRFKVQRRTMLQAEVWRGGRKAASRLALNDVVVLRGVSAKLALLETRVDGRPLATYKADGLLVATPTGSTAYSLSVGGPVLEPRSRNFILAPISPHTLSVRPLVLPDSSVLELKVPQGRAPLHFSSDGEQGFGLKAGDRLLIRRYAKPAKLLVPPGYDYWEVLRNKLGWRGN